MIGGDATVAWMDHATGQGFADDYYLDAKSQCAGGKGACPDKNIRRGRNDVRLLNSAIINDFTMLTYRFVSLSSGRVFSCEILCKPHARTCITKTHICRRKRMT